VSGRVYLWSMLFWRESLRALARHRLRSGLTTLGIAIGIAALVLVVTVGEAGSRRAQAALDDLGENLVWIEAGARNINGVRNGTHGTTSLTVEDAEAIARDIRLIRLLSPQADGSAQVIYGNRNWFTRYRGETPDYLKIKRWRIAAGANFSDEDVAASASKILIGRTVRDQLFGDVDPIGQTVVINRQPFEVVGVLAQKGQTADGRDQDDWFLLPHTTVQRKLRGRGIPYLDDILCSAVSPEAVAPAIAAVTALLRERHHIRPGDEDDFNIRRPEEVIQAQKAAGETLAGLLISVAGVALLVGGIGIMNVMLASVAQRTREIGLRLAVGAPASAIVVQFLGEAIVLSVIGGAAGVVLSIVAAAGFGRFSEWQMTIPLHGVALAVASSAAVGLFFGAYPARRAARLDPIEALRHE
jgi:putative ABC transport system permease protein